MANISKDSSISKFAFNFNYHLIGSCNFCAVCQNIIIIIIYLLTHPNSIHRNENFKPLKCQAACSDLLIPMFIFMNHFLHLQELNSSVGSLTKVKTKMMMNNKVTYGFHSFALLSLQTELGSDTYPTEPSLLSDCWYNRQNCRFGFA